MSELKIGEWIKSVRKKTRLTRDEIAGIVGVKTRTLYSWENNERTPPDAAVEIIKEIEAGKRGVEKTPQPPQATYTGVIDAAAYYRLEGRLEQAERDRDALYERIGQHLARLDAGCVQSAQAGDRGLKTDREHVQRRAVAHTAR